MKNKKINNEPLKKLLDRLESWMRRREDYEDNRSDAWYESDKAVLFNDETDELDEIIQELDMTIDLIEEWNKKID